MDNCDPEYNLKTVGAPAISTGAYGYPLRQAAHIALHTIVEYLEGHQDIHLVRFVLYDKSTYDIFAEELQKVQ